MCRKVIALLLLPLYSNCMRPALDSYTNYSNEARGLFEECLDGADLEVVSHDFPKDSRPLICEPGLVKRWQAGDRRKAECISCNSCFGPPSEGKGFYCVTMAKKRGKTSWALIVVSAFRISIRGSLLDIKATLVCLRDRTWQGTSPGGSCSMLSASPHLLLSIPQSAFDPWLLTPVPVLYPDPYTLPLRLQISCILRIVVVRSFH